MIKVKVNKLLIIHEHISDFRIIYNGEKNLISPYILEMQAIVNTIMNLWVP
jgi:hypothetical protein